MPCHIVPHCSRLVTLVLLRINFDPGSTIIFFAFANCNSELFIVSSELLVIIKFSLKRYTFVFQISL